MKIRHFFFLGVWAIAAITGGLFVADRRVVTDILITSQRIATGTPLRLGVLLSETPTSRDRNDAMIRVLYSLQEQINRCGGINQAPVFWVMETPTPFPKNQDADKQDTNNQDTNNQDTNNQDTGNQDADSQDTNNQGSNNQTFELSAIDALGKG
ncbi:MAG: hypothetical protein F6K09_38215, partial [Merismopedia sp. SIO2A8]|nr:hypothetical protein [Merismopedia sp. SIO2A8]